MQEAFNKYNTFSIEIIEYTKACDIRENYWIKTLNPPLNLKRTFSNK